MSIKPVATFSSSPPGWRKPLWGQDLWKQPRIVWISNCELDMLMLSEVLFLDIPGKLYWTLTKSTTVTVFTIMVDTYASYFAVFPSYTSRSDGDTEQRFFVSWRQIHISDSSVEIHCCRDPYTWTRCHVLNPRGAGITPLIMCLKQNENKQTNPTKLYIK